MPDRTRKLLPELATFGPPDPLLLLLSRSVGCYYLPTVDRGLELPVHLTKDCPIVRPRWTAGFELLFGVGFRRVERSFNAVVQFPKSESAFGSLMAWYAAVVAHGVTFMVECYLALD